TDQSCMATAAARHSTATPGATTQPRNAAPPSANQTESPPDPSRHKCSPVQSTGPAHALTTARHSHPQQQPHGACSPQDATATSGHPPASGPSAAPQPSPEQTEPPPHQTESPASHPKRSPSNPPRPCRSQKPRSSSQLVRPSAHAE